MDKALPFLRSLKKGDKIFLVLSGIIIDATFEELDKDNCAVLTDVTSPSMAQGNLNLSIPVESILAWGKQPAK